MSCQVDVINKIVNHKKMNEQVAAGLKVLQNETKGINLFFVKENIVVITTLLYFRFNTHAYKSYGNCF